MMEYKIVMGMEFEDLAREVSREIELGWRPLGGVCASWYGETDGCTEYLQAMIKEKE